MDYSYLNNSPVPKKRKRMCSNCLSENGLQNIKSEKGTFSVTHGICERRFKQQIKQQMLEIGLTVEEIDLKVRDLKEKLGEKAFCLDFDVVFQG